MDWSEEQKNEIRLAYVVGGLFAGVAKAVDLVAARGGTEEDANVIDNAREWCARVTRPEPLHPNNMRVLLAIIAAQGARVAVLEAEVSSRAGNIAEQREYITTLQERLKGEEDGNRDLVRRAQQAESVAEQCRKMAREMNIKAVENRVRAEIATARCAILSAAGQVLSAHVDKVTGEVMCTCGGQPHFPDCEWLKAQAPIVKTGEPDDGCDLCGQHGGGHGYMPSQYDEVPQKCPNAANRHPCSSTCTHDDAATPGHPERVKERSEAVNKAVDVPADHDWGENEPDPYQRGAEAMRAACWEAAQAVLGKYGWTRNQQGWNDIKSAIEGAAP